MRRIGFWVLLAQLFLGVNLPAQEGRPDLGGYVKFYHHNFTARSGEYSRSGARLQLNVTKTFSDRGDLFASIDFDANDLLSGLKGYAQRGAGFEIYPVELYGSLYFSRLDIRVGKQFIFWGKTDWVNPTDNICPWDYANISSELEDYRLPVTSLKIDYYLRNLTTEIVWIPVFVPHRIPFRSGILSEPDMILGTPGIEMTSATYPRTSLRNSQVGVRLSSHIQGIDYSLSYYSGHDKNPSMISTFSSAKQFVEIQPQYKTIHVLGGDFDRTFGRWGFKGEAAYFFTQDPAGTNTEIANPHFQSVLGVDYTFTEEFVFNLQWIQDIKRNFHPEVEEEAALRAPLPQPPPSRVNRSFSWFLKWEPLDYLTFQWIGVYNLNNRDSFLLSFFTYEIADGMNFTFGTLLFNGPEDSTFGKMDDADKIFLEMKFSF